MLKPLILYAMLLAGTATQAQKTEHLNPRIIKGVEFSTMVIPVGCPEASMRHSILLGPWEHHTIALGIDLSMGQSTAPSLRLAYIGEVVRLNDQWALNLSMDTRHFYSKDKEHWSYTVVSNTRPPEMETINVTETYTEYTTDQYMGFGATWDFYPGLALNFAVGPTLEISRFKRTSENDPYGHDYNYTRMEYHVFSTFGLVYKFKQPLVTVAK